MRTIARIPGLLFVSVLLMLSASSGCSFIGALLGFEDSQREWAGNPADVNPRHAEESLRHNAELSRIYD